MQSIFWHLPCFDQIARICFDLFFFDLFRRSQHLCHVGLTSTWSTAHAQTQSHDGIRSHVMTCIKVTTVHARR